MHSVYVYRILKNPLKFLKRMRYKKIDFDNKKIIDKKIGFRIFNKNELINTDKLLADLKKWSTNKIRTLDKKEIVALAKKGSIKPYYLNLLELEDLKNLKSLKSFIQSNELINLLFKYYGFIPHLSHLAVFYSNNSLYVNKSGTNLGTQNAHFDNHDLKHVKIFLNISDVTKESGPLHIYNKSISNYFKINTGRRFKRKPVRDDHELQIIKGNGVDLIGNSGTLGIVDTTNCLHYGSRVGNNKGRITLVIHFVCFDAYSLRKTKKYEDLNIGAEGQLKQEFWPVG